MGRRKISIETTEWYSHFRCCIHCFNAKDYKTFWFHVGTVDDKSNCKRCCTIPFDGMVPFLLVLHDYWGYFLPLSNELQPEGLPLPGNVYLCGRGYWKARFVDWAILLSVQVLFPKKSDAPYLREVYRKFLKKMHFLVWLSLHTIPKIICFCKLKVINGSLKPWVFPAIPADIFLSLPIETKQ